MTIQTIGKPFASSETAECSRLKIALEMRRNRFRWTDEVLSEVAIWGDSDHAYCARMELERRKGWGARTEIIGSSVGLALCACSAFFFSIALAPDRAFAATVETATGSRIGDFLFAWFAVSFIVGGFYAALRWRTRPHDYSRGVEDYGDTTGLDAPRVRRFVEQEERADEAA